MKKIIYFIVLLAIVSCKSNPLPPVVEECPSAMAPFTLGTMVDRGLQPEDLVGSKASTSADLILETLTTHEVDSSGIHVFNKDKIIIPGNSVGVIEKKPEGGEVATVVIPTFYRNDQGESYSVEFELERSPYINIIYDEVSEQEVNDLMEQGGHIDQYGFLRYEDQYFVYSNESGLFIPEKLAGHYPEQYVVKVLREGEEEALKSEFDNLKYSVSSEGFLIFDGRYVIQNSANKKIYFTQTLVTLNQLKYRECGDVKIIDTPSFDEKIR